MRSPLSLLAFGAAGGLLATAVVAWLVPVSLASSGLLIIGRDTLAALLPTLHTHRLLLAGLAGLGGLLGLACSWGVPPVPGAGLLVGIGVAAEVSVLIAAAPLAVAVVGLLILNLAAWVLLLRVVFAVLRLIAP